MSSPTSVYNNKYQIINNFKILHTFNNILMNYILFPGILHCAALAPPIALAIFTPCPITSQVIGLLRRPHLLLMIQLAEG